MTINVWCPVCGKAWKQSEVKSDRTYSEFLAQLCPAHAAERAAAIHARDDVPVGGLSCTDEMEDKMHDGGGYHDAEWRMMQSHARNGRVIRKSEPMGG